MSNVKRPNIVLDDKPQQALEKRSRNDDLTDDKPQQALEKRSRNDDLTENSGKR